MKRKILLISLLLTAAIFLIGFNIKSKIKVSSLAVVPSPTPQATSVDSPDMKETLSLKVKKAGEIATYSLTVTNKSDGSVKEIFSKTIGKNESISIATNTWSPDSKYVLMKENNDFFVLSSLVSSDSQDDQTFNINDLFVKKYQNYIITDATGWASPTLVVFNVNKEDNTLGPSFWFEIPSKAFIPLSTRFN